MQTAMREGLTGRSRSATTARLAAPPAPAASASAQGVAAYPRRLLKRIAICLVVGLVLPGWPHRGELSPEGPEAFVPAAPAGSLRTHRLRGAPERLVPRRAEPDESEDNEALRAKVAELQKRLIQQDAAAEEASLRQAASQAAAATPAPVNPAVLKAYEAVIEDLPVLEEVDNARLGLVAEKQYVFQQGDASRENPIYKRKYEVLGMTLNQQEAYMKAFKKAVKVAKKSSAVEYMVTLWKEGGEGLDRKEVRTEIDKLTKESRIARLMFRDILPEVMEDPIKDAIGGILATFGLIGVSLLLCFCFFPPIPPDVD